MKANINLELSKSDLNYELECLVSEIASEQVNKLVKEKAEELVENEVKRIIEPIVDSYLRTVVVGEEYRSMYDDKPPRSDVDKYIKRILQNYLDEPCFVFSKTSSKLGERYMPSSSGGSKTTGAEYWIIDKVREYTNTELFEKIEDAIDNKIKQIVPSEDQIQEIIKNEIKAKLN